MPVGFETWIERAVDVIVVALIVLLVMLSLISVGRLLIGE